ncbi:MAG: Curli production assembly/transport component CsgG [Verrucomicrobia bacterium ADurb.Bin063]|jgi:curli biogenesis system outer membrane secretion channel CsgG|nr:MAG: Curli production assembly/transport component CsgG [Verrucomicrobia bacterium ADurb.Bin063]
MNMKKNLLAFLYHAMLAAGITGYTLAAEDTLPSLIVAPFSGDTTAIQYWQPALGQGLSEMLITEMGKLNKFQVLESTQLGTLMDEIKLGEDGWVQQDEKVEKGGFAAADFMLTAKVTRFGNKQTKVGLGGFVPGSLGNLGLKQTTADVRIDWRLVDAATRKIIKTGSATAAQKGTGFDVGVNVTGHGGGIGFDNKEFMDSALGKATVTALNQITEDVRAFSLPESGRRKQKANAASQQAAAAQAAAQAARATPGKVLAVAGKDAVIVSLGSNLGFKVGDKLDLYETVDIKDASGAVVFSEEKLIGEVILQTVQADRSKASYSGNAEVKPGWVVKAK